LKVYSCPYQLIEQQYTEYSRKIITLEFRPLLGHRNKQTRNHFQTKLGAFSLDEYLSKTQIFFFSFFFHLPYNLNSQYPNPGYLRAPNLHSPSPSKSFEKYGCKTAKWQQPEIIL